MPIITNLRNGNKWVFITIYFLRQLGDEATGAHRAELRVGTACFVRTRAMPTPPTGVCGAETTITVNNLVVLLFQISQLESAAECQNEQLNIRKVRSAFIS